MKQNVESNLHGLAALVTWLVVFSLGLIMVRNASAPYSERLVEFVLMQVMFLGFMMATVRDSHVYGRRPMGYVLLACAIACVFWLGWRFPVSFLPIYSIMWVTLLPLYFSTRTNLVLLVATIACWYLIEKLAWNSADPLLEVLLFGTFHMFALFSSMVARRAEEASRHARELNRDLLATQQLLEDAAKENERTRIARDLHDQLGHHMTALTINLQVASRLADGEVKEKVDQCHVLSKELLADVRKAVSTLREQSTLDVGGSLQRLVENVPGLTVHLDVEPELAVTDVSVAEALIRCVQEGITNTLRHARASESWIRLWRENGMLRLDIRDNGKNRQSIVPGNGLSGMRERIEKLNGQLTLGQDPAFTIQVLLPAANGV